jgi:prephenate dehydrogenase
VAPYQSEPDLRNAPYIKELRRIAIVGVGLMGGSFGLAVRAAGAPARRIGIGRRQSTLDLALAYDAVDEVTLDMAEGVRSADLVVVCTPIGAMESMFKAMAAHLPDGCVVTDVASTKAHVCRIAERILPRSVRFVGSHPIAGSEKTSVEYARADLFQNAVCIVSPTRRSNPVAVRNLIDLWRAVGGHPYTLPPRRHDQVLARVSHLPHAVAAALVLLADAGKGTRYAGTGFGDTTRIASGDPVLWRDIFASNRTAVLHAIDRLERELKHFRQMMQRDDDEALLAWLSRAKAVRDAWVRQRYAQKEIEP